MSFCATVRKKWHWMGGKAGVLKSSFLMMGHIVDRP